MAEASRKAANGLEVADTTTYDTDTGQVAAVSPSAGTTTHSSDQLGRNTTSQGGVRAPLVRGDPVYIGSLDEYLLFCSS
jgi:co-chaperonin GroES (HSP10)